jgi:hypothetical protein
MRQFTILILISALSLVFTQCTVKPAKRTHENAIGIWVGIGGAGHGKVGAGGYVVGVDIKRFPKNFYNASFNANSGIIFGYGYGIVVDAGFNLLTGDLYRKGFWLDGAVAPGTQAFQFYGGPSLGANLLMSKNGKLGFNPTIGASGGMLMLFPPSRTSFGKYPESDLSFEGTLHTNYVIARILHNLYLF